jgi:tetratricopeptide (TPR) repeat protein
MAVIGALGGLYFYAAGRRNGRAADPASMLERARELAARGRTGKAMALVIEIIRLSPWFWQALEYRAELYSAQGNTEAAARDLGEAARLGGPVIGLPQTPSETPKGEGIP